MLMQHTKNLNPKRFESGYIELAESVSITWIQHGLIYNFLSLVNAMMNSC